MARGKSWGLMRTDKAGLAVRFGNSGLTLGSPAMLLMMAAGTLGELSTLHRVRINDDCDNNSDSDVSHPPSQKYQL